METSHEIVKSRKKNDAVAIQPATPSELLTLAVSKDLDIDKLAKLMELQEAWNKEQARKAFFNSLMEFQANVPELRKSKKVSFKTNSGLTEYHFAPLSDIVRQIKDTCKAYGLSYRWEIQDTKDEIKVTCLVTHVDGHTEQTTMTASPDASGGKNSIQARGSSIEYLKRYTLIGALGLSTADSDVDGQFPEIDIDILHKQYIVLYNQLIERDANYTKWHPDNWRSEKTAKLYLKAIGDIRRKLAELTPKEA